MAARIAAGQHEGRSRHCLAFLHAFEACMANVSLHEKLLHLPKNILLLCCMRIVAHQPQATNFQQLLLEYHCKPSWQGITLPLGAPLMPEMPCPRAVRLCMLAHLGQIMPRGGLKSCQYHPQMGIVRPDAKPEAGCRLDMECGCMLTGHCIAAG